MIKISTLKDVLDEPVFYVITGLFFIIIFDVLPIWVEIFWIIVIGFYYKFKKMENNNNG